MATLLSLFKDEDDAPKTSGCGMCGGDHGLDEDCAMDEDAQDFADYDKNIRAKRFDKKQSGRGSEEYLNRQANRDKAERIATLQRRIARAKVLARSGGNPHAKKRLRDFYQELKQLMGTTKEVEEGWDNEPEEEIEAYEPNKHAGGINRPKKKYNMKNPGDPSGDPIREQEELESKIKAELTALYKL